MQISLYKTLDEQLHELANIQLFSPNFSYNNVDGEEQQFKFSEPDNQYILNEADSEWSPIENNLIVRQKFIINNPEKLFGDNGLTNEVNKLGLACHIYSKTSNFQQTIHVADIESSSGNMTIPFEHIFDENYLGGTVFFEFYIYLKELNLEQIFKAKKIGTNLTEGYLYRYSFIVDGSGSEFPIEEINDPSQPLWRVEMNWTDVFEDLFNTTSVRLILNQAHPIFKQLMNQKNRINQYLMNDIIINAIAMVIQQSILIEKNEIDEDGDYQPGSVAQVIWYWISTYEVNLESIDAISNSIRKNADPFTGED